VGLVERSLDTSTSFLEAPTSTSIYIQIRNSESRIETIREIEKESELRMRVKNGVGDGYSSVGSSNFLPWSLKRTN
jgi:hypothetical protein